MPIHNPAVGPVLLGRQAPWR